MSSIDTIVVGQTEYSLAGGGAGGIDYSTTEQDTGLHWIDGKPIYQIVTYDPIEDFSSGIPYSTQTELTDDVTNFASYPAGSRAITINVNSLKLEPLAMSDNYIRCTQAFTTEYVKVTVTKTKGTVTQFCGYKLGSTLGGTDIYSYNWGTMAEGSTQTLIIDMSKYLSQSKSSAIYLSFMITVNSGNNAFFEITSVKTSDGYGTIIKDNEEIKDNNKNAIAYVSQYTKTSISED